MDQRGRKTDISFDELHESGHYRTLDAKLAAAISVILKGDLAKQFNVLDEKYAAIDKIVKGRHMLLKIYQHYHLSHAEGSLYDFTDLMNVRLMNNDLKTFQADWDLILAGMRKVPDKEWLEHIYLPSYHTTGQRLRASAY